MASSCYIHLGLSPEELKKAKANEASKKSKAKKTMLPVVDEIKAIDPLGTGVTAQKVTDDLANNVITPDQYKQIINDLHATAKYNQAQQLLAKAQADADAAAALLQKAELADAKAKANFASMKSKSKKKATQLVDLLHGAGYTDEAIALSNKIDQMAAGYLSPQDLQLATKQLEHLPSTPAIQAIPTAKGTADDLKDFKLFPDEPPVKVADNKAKAWQDAWAKTDANPQLQAKDFPWAKDEYMLKHGSDYSPYVQNKNAGFPDMTPRQSQVVKAAQNKQLEFPIVDVDLAKADFVPTQHGGLKAIVNKYIKKMPDDKFPRAYFWKGQYHLTNGHHRVMAAYIRGDAHLPVQVIDLDQLADADMWPGNLQSLVDSLNPPTHSVPSSKISKSAQDKFGVKPSAAESSLSASPVPSSGPPPAAIAPSMPVQGLTVPKDTQAVLDNLNTTLNQHPVFKAADDAKKAAKKASSDKFYAKKKVETAIDQAKAAGKLQLEHDLTKLYDDISAGKIVTNAKDVMPLIADVKVQAGVKNVAENLPTPAVVHAPTPTTALVEPKMTTASGLPADQLLNESLTGYYPIDPWIEVGGVDVMPTDDKLQAYYEWLGEVNPPTYSLPANTPLVSVKNQFSTKSAKQSVKSGQLLNTPKVYKLNGNFYVASNGGDIVAAKAMNWPEVKVDFKDFDTPGQKQLPNLGGPATDAPKTFDDIDYAYQQLASEAAADELSLELDMIANIMTPDEQLTWAIGKYSQLADDYAKAGIKAPDDLANLFEAAKYKYVTDEQIADMLVFYPDFEEQLLTSMYNKANKAKKATEIVDFVAPPSTLQYVNDATDIAKTTLTKFPPDVMEQAIHIVEQAKTGMPLPDVQTAFNDYMAKMTQEYNSLVNKMSYGKAKYAEQYNPDLQLQMHQLHDNFAAGKINYVDALDQYAEIEAAYLKWTPPPMKSSGALSSAKSGAKKKLYAAKMEAKAAGDTPRMQALYQLEQALANDMFKVYNASDIDKVIANIDVTAWSGKSIPALKFNPPKVTAYATGPYKELPKTQGELIDLANKKSVTAFDVFGDAGGYENVTTGLAEHQKKWLDKKLADLGAAPSFEYRTMSIASTTRFYTLTDVKLDSDKLAKIASAGGDAQVGRPIVMKDGDRWIVLSGHETILEAQVYGKTWVDMRVVDLEDLRKMPDYGKVPDYHLQPEAIDHAYKASAFSNAEVAQADDWLKNNVSRLGGKKVERIAEIAKADPAYREALQQTGWTDAQFTSFVRERIDVWNCHSSKTADMVAMHMVVADMFNLSQDAIRKTPNWLKTVPAAQRILGKQGKAYEVMVRAMYETTQAEFRKLGITHVSMYRGFGFPEPVEYMPEGFKDYLIGDTFAYANQSLPLQSWSTNKHTARKFAFKDWGYVTSAQVPVEYVFSTGITGLGIMAQEAEFVLMAAPGTVHYEVVSRPDNIKRPKE